MKVLLLGGTAEARELAERLTGERGYDIVSSLAGRVSQPVLPPGVVRSGGFGGVDGLRDWLIANAIDAVIDATHPFAATISRHAASAADTLGLPIAAVLRPAWQPGPGDNWMSVSSIHDAAAKAAVLGGRIFLTIGRQGTGHFSAIAGAWFLIRSIEPPAGPLPPRHELLLARGPFTVSSEVDTLRSERITAIITKNSGSPATAAKLEAARQLHLPVVMIERPPPAPDVPHLPSVSAAAEWLAAQRNTWLRRRPYPYPPPAEEAGS